MMLTIPGFSGTLIHPGDAGYDAARAVFNRMIDRRPALIACCRNPDDVVLAVKLALETGLPVSVYGGGHAVTGYAVCDDGIVIDLRGMKTITVDPVARTCRAEAGLTWGEFDAATGAHGLAVTGGRNPNTGIAGLSLGSGSGWLERKLGYACDNVLALEIVTADARRVTASATENPDLYWAVRGGGGNFGVVTSFRFQLARLPEELLGGVVVYRPEDAGAVLRHFREFMAEAPDDIGGAVALTAAPDIPPVPAELRNRAAVLVNLLYAGPMAEAIPALAPLRGFGRPVVDLVGPTSYPAFQAAGPTWSDLRNYWTADFYDDLPDAAVNRLAEIALDPVSPTSNTFIAPGGGKAGRIPEDDNAFGERRAAFNIHYLSSWPDAADDARHIARTRAMSAALKPWSTGRVYLNYIGNEGQARIDNAFGPAKMARLQAIKAKWDPHNLFRNNQNIRPAVAVTA